MVLWKLYTTLKFKNKPTSMFRYALFYRPSHICIYIPSGSMPMHTVGAVVTSLSKELYSHCFSPSSFIVVNKVLALTREACAKLAISHLKD